MSCDPVTPNQCKAVLLNGTNKTHHLPVTRLRLSRFADLYMRKSATLQNKGKTKTEEAIFFQSKNVCTTVTSRIKNKTPLELKWRQYNTQKSQVFNFHVQAECLVICFSDHKSSKQRFHFSTFLLDFCKYHRNIYQKWNMWKKWSAFWYCGYG